MYLDDYNQSSELQQTELLKGWSNTFEQALTIGKAGAKELQSVVSGLQGEINKLVIDEDVLTDSAIGTKFEKRPEVKKENNNSGSTSTNKYNYSTTNDKNNNKDINSDYYTIKINDGNGNVTYEKVKKGDSFKLYDKNAMPRDGYTFQGWTYNGQSIAGASGGTYTPTSDMEVVASWKSNGGSSSSSSSTGAAFKSGQHLKTKEAWGYVTSYKFNSKGELVGSHTSGLLVNSPVDFVVDGEPVLYKGQWYYKVKDSSMPSWGIPNGYWMKGLQLKKYKTGGMVYGTGPAWLDGTSSQPEAVLNAMQTKAFLSFTDDLAALRAEGSASTNSSVVIDNISFNVESMSSVADGEKAFNAFVDKFKEIGAKQGISVLGTANRN
jgi:hypothetical protein